MTLEGKIALVTGASRGIGRAIAFELAQLGAQVIGTATTAENAATIDQFLAENQFHGKGIVMNVAEPDSVKAALASVIENFDSPAILVNNAGITRDNIMLRMKEEQWDEVINTNLNSIYRVTKLCLRGMIKKRWGRVINITSVVGCTGNAGQANYAAAKAGIIGFSKSLAQELAMREITINTVAPGFIATDMTKEIQPKHQELILQQIPMGRMGTTAEIANAVGFLASPRASYITGQTIHVNGGMFMG